MKTFMIINGSPRKDGISAELVKQVKPYFWIAKLRNIIFMIWLPRPARIANIANITRAAQIMIWIYF